MDRKSIILLVGSLILLVGLYWASNRFFPPVPLPPEATQASNNFAAPTPEPARSNLAEEPLPPRAPVLGTNVPEQTLTLTNELALYTFTSHGGGLKSIELEQYSATVECRKRTAATEKQHATLNLTAPAPIMAVLDGAAVQGDGVFQLSRTATGIRAQKDLTNGLRLVKEFRLSTNYLIKASVRLENRAVPAHPIDLPEQDWIIGTSTPMSQRDESLTLGLDWYNGSQGQRIDSTWFANRTLGCFPGKPRQQYGPIGSSNVFWAAVHNQFFAIIAVPDKPAAQLVGRKVYLPAPTPEQVATESHILANPFGYEAAFIYPGEVLPPNQSIERQFEIYAGPKEYNTLARLGNNLDFVMGFSGFFGFFAKALLLSMNGLHAVGTPYAVTIIAITVIIKVVFWPLTQASTRSMKRMQELQPQMKALQEKYKEDPRKMNAKLMEFMRENKVSPLGGCLPMVLQIPVFFGFYRMLQSAIELRGARFLWACDLSQPDTVWIIPGMNFPLNPLPLVMGVTMLWQSRLTPASPGMDPAQQKMMRYMPLMMMVFLYNFSAGLTLYWTVQNLLTIAQMKLTRSQTSKNPAPASPGLPARGAPKKKK